jgi:serine/threonine protein kinase
MVDRVGQQLGHYRLLRLLGQGGFADVYLAEHVHLQTQVAVKVLSMRLAGEYVEQFRTEARTVARLVHPHIVRVLDFGVEDGIPYLVMDYAPGGTLRMVHPKGTRLPLETIVDYVKQVAQALQYAHERKLIHRDIKPENMLLGENGQVVLSDFGIALVAQSTRYQSTQEVIGTAAYMAPEQLQGKPRRASDQYALAIVVYKWVCGDRPFHGSFPEIYSQHLFVPPPSLREKVPELPPAVEEVVRVALSKEPERRFASVQAFATALEQACQRAPSQEGILPTDSVFSRDPSLSQQTVPAVPSTPLPQAMNVQTPPSLPLHSPMTPSPVHPSSVQFPAKRERGGTLSSPSSAYRLSLRLIFCGLAALLLLSGGFTWLMLSHPLFGSAVPPVLTATAAPSPPATPTTMPTPTPTAKPSPTPTATPSPTPTPTPLIVIHPTLTTDCAHLVTPWVALYQYSHFGGRELCFEGKGLINLADFGFDKQTEAINIAANGVFFDQPNGKGTQLGFYYGDEQADLGNWDNRISSFRVDG